MCAVDCDWLQPGIEPVTKHLEAVLTDELHSQKHHIKISPITICNHKIAQHTSIVVLKCTFRTLF